MIQSIKIQGYRGFADFEMIGLKRVCLLVGTNNSGKTSALESLLLLASQGDPFSLWRVLWRRNERMAETRPNADYPELDLCHVFNGHDLHLGTHFSLEATNQTPSRKLTFTIAEIPEEQRASVIREGQPLPSRIGLHIKGTPHPQSDIIPLSRNGGLSSEAMSAPRRVRKRDREVNEIPSQFITAESYDSEDLLSLWDTIALTPNEERVLTALRLLEPEIERIAATAANLPRYYGAAQQRGGFRVRFRNSERPVPIGSMGDGMWRLLVMAIAIAQCKDGILLIDEIDTGLHYSVMTNMWKLIFGAAKELNVQVFATTHSYDCVKSLAELCHTDPKAADEVTLQRIERGRKKAIPYTPAEIATAALHQIEVR